MAFRFSFVFAFLLCLGLVWPTTEARADWLKVTPITCAVVVTSSPIGLTAPSLTISGVPTSDPYELLYAYCQVDLPDSVTVDRLRIRTASLPNYVAVQVQLWRHSWSGSSSMMAECFTNTAHTTWVDDTTISNATISNGDYEYYLEIYLYADDSASSSPELRMIEIEY